MFLLQIENHARSCRRPPGETKLYLELHMDQVLNFYLP